MRKVHARIALGFAARFGRLYDRLRPSYQPSVPPGNLNELFGFIDADVPTESRAVLQSLWSHYRLHRFDLLGSGWVRVALDRPHVDADGGWLKAHVGAANLTESGRIWGLVDPGYDPIDWQLDFKSGHRWSAARHSTSIPTWGNPPGVDIKVPWELARCQHLPQLALAYLSSPDPALPAEFRNQVLDFVAQNPPRFGVNWVCAMDVAIRIANWVVARDLFCGAGGVKFDGPFEEVMLRSTYEHARHVVTHLEWSEALRGNHYLADISGLLFASAALPPTEETDLWLSFAIQELVNETRSQFYEEGANFEASTVYHRLSAEFAAYGAALVLGLPQERVQRLARVPAGPVGRGPRYEGLGEVLDSAKNTLVLPPWFADRVCGMAQFVSDISRADGTVIQFGDNDSGRLFKLPGAYRMTSAGELKQDPVPCPDEEVLDHRDLVSAIEGLMGGGESFQGRLIGALARGRRLQAGKIRRSEDVRIGDDADWTHVQAAMAQLPPSHRQTYRFPVAAARSEARAFGYRQFGLYGWRQENWSAWLRCGPVGQNGVGGHAHNDALGLEVEIAGVAVACDPGTYVYTPYPEARNRYRSAAAHFVPRIANREPASLHNGLFVLPDTPGLQCLYFGTKGFAGVHEGYGEKVMRIVRIEPGAIAVEDGSWGEPLERCILPSPVPVSPKYGALLR